jgi:ATP-dependent RNA helicase DDX47/RRP3
VNEDVGAYSGWPDGE